MRIAFLGAAALCLFAAPAFAGLGYHTAVKIQATGINFNAGTGVTAGYVAGTVDRAPVVDKDGKALASAGSVCGRGDGVNTFTNLNSKATASATNVPNATAGGLISNIANPSLALATGDVTGNGGGGMIAAAAMTEHPADVLAAYCGNAGLPNAPAGSVVRDGIQPVAAPAH